MASQWGIWFIYQGESYEGNVHLVTTLSSIADFAYFWSFSPIASLSNFFLRDDYKQKAYRSFNLATLSTEHRNALTRLRSSEKESSQNGKMSKIKKVDDLSSKCLKARQIKRRFMKVSPLKSLASNSISVKK